MNKSTIATILGTAALGLMKSSGSRNFISSIDELIESANDPDKAPFVTLISLPYSNITYLPKEIGNFVNLKTIHLPDNNLTSLPEEIENLINLRRLELSNNNLTSIPKEIGNLINLRKLELSNNNLTSIPKEIGNLVNLKELWLDGNNLTSLPTKIGNLVNLKSTRFDLYGNNIQMPNRETLQYWMKNLKPNMFREIMENIGPSSQLRRF
jgi:Leucine-rich repeat (LRR) protein